MSYLIELRTPTCPAAYVLAQAANSDNARALIDARIEREEDMEGVEIIAVHPVH